MNKVRGTLVVLLFINTLIMYGQHKEKTMELAKIEVKRENFKSILDSLIQHEKICDYYSPDLLFVINIKKKSEHTSILIESIDDKNIALDLKPYGYFYRGNHLFLVEGDELDCLLRITEIKNEFEYLEYDIFYEEYNDEGQRVLRVILDDSFSQWEFSYSGENLILRKQNTACE